MVGAKADIVPGNTADLAQQPEVPHAFDAQSIWRGDGPPTGAHSESPGLAMGEQHVDSLLDSARASQRKEIAGLPKQIPDGQATLRAAKGYTTAEVRGWLAEVRMRKARDGKPKVKKAQL